MEPDPNFPDLLLQDVAKEGKKIVIGICAMQRKATSKPMKAIMTRVIENYMNWLEYFVFDEATIINEPVEKWPICDCLISFHSTDFPLHKAIEYVKLRKPYVVNDLKRQYDLLDRRKVFRTLAKVGISHPRHGVMVRGDPNEPDGELVEHNDHIEVNGMVFNKPFVEKPISAEDHNIYIYYPSSVGGGSQRLFRKGTMSIRGKTIKAWHINNRASYYSPVSTVRTDGSFVYEDFIPADGTDVKVYAVGPYYAHAEARKAPGLDGKVERDANGKEVRYPVILSNKEKMIAKTIVTSFRQTVCGFDLLRANGESYVCDVNGFSFVKTSHKYYEDTAKILGDAIIRGVMKSMAPKLPPHLSMPDPPLLDLGLGDDPPFVSTPSGKIMELRCVIAVIRHGDRTPKQKMKLVVQDERFFELFKKYDGFKKNEIKMKRPNQLTEVLELAKQILLEQYKIRNDILQELEASEELLTTEDAFEHRLETVDESIKKWEQLRTVLEMYGHFSGINRKVQLKYLKGKEKKSDEDSSSSFQNVPPLLLILKWGGELTTAGTLQAEALGKLFRTLYPGIRRTDGKNIPEDKQGLGFLRLHSTYRHDLKIYASDEGRVQMTAAAFAKGMLALEGELTPILMQMVKSANTDGLLDDDCKARDFQGELKTYLHQALQVDRDWTPEDYHALNPNGLRSVTNALEFIKNPKQMCNEIAGYVKKMCETISHHKITRPTHALYQNESWDLAQRRWSKELREFQRSNKNGDVEYDISKIPDIYDNIKYDLEHNPELCGGQETDLERMYLCVKNMADIVVPQEYGIKKENKVCVAQRVCTPLLKKIRNDLHRCTLEPVEDENPTRLDPRASQGIATPFRHVRTRLYFTSESHIHTLMNLLRYGNLCSVDDKKWQRAMNFLSGVTEFNYMTQIVFMVYEDSCAETKERKFHIEVMFSPGLYPCFLTEKERIYNVRRMNNSNSMSKSHSRDGGTSPHNQGGSENKETAPTSGRSTPPKEELSVATPIEEKRTAAKAVGLVSPVEHSADSDDHLEELNDSESVNLVALNEVTKLNVDSEGNIKRQRRKSGSDKDKASEEGDKPKEDLSEWRKPIGNTLESVVTKSPSQVSVGEDDYQATVGASRGKWAKDLIEDAKNALMTEIKEVEHVEESKEKMEKKTEPANNRTEANGTDEKSRRSRFPYKFKHHTVNLLNDIPRGLKSKLISTDVLMGRFSVETVSDDKNNKNKNHYDYSTGSPVLSTAVIARSSSAPRLQTFKADEGLLVNDIRRFWPPLRSLETLHDNIRFEDFDRFLFNLLTARTPIPSPPKTPLLSVEHVPTNLETLCEQVNRLKQLSLDNAEE